MEGENGVPSKRLDLAATYRWATEELSHLTKEIPGLKGNGYLVYSSTKGQCPITGREEDVYAQFPEFFLLDHNDQFNQLTAQMVQKSKQLGLTLEQTKKFKAGSDYQSYLSRVRTLSVKRSEAVTQGEAVDQIDSQIGALGSCSAAKEVQVLIQTEQSLSQELSSLAESRTQILRNAPIALDVAMEFRFATLDYRVIDLLKAHPRIRQPPSMMSRAYIRIVLINLKSPMNVSHKEAHNV